MWSIVPGLKDRDVCVCERNFKQSFAVYVKVLNVWGLYSSSGRRNVGQVWAKLGLELYSPCHLHGGTDKWAKSKNPRIGPQLNSSPNCVLLEYVTGYITIVKRRLFDERTEYFSLMYTDSSITNRTCGGPTKLLDSFNQVLWKYGGLG